MEEEVKKELQKILKEEVVLEVPKDSKLGDYSFPCFSLAKKLKKNPNEIALELSKKIRGDFDVEVKGAYLNFFINKEKLAKKILGLVLKEKNKYGIGKGKKHFLIEYPSPNTNKP